MIDLVLKGKSVFFTGAAGTGKSFLLKKLHQVRRDFSLAVVVMRCRRCRRYRRCVDVIDVMPCSRFVVVVVVVVANVSSVL